VFELRIRWLGHAAFLLEGSNRVLIDPFITGNPAAEGAGIRASEVKCDVVCVTHAHGDHYGDAVKIARANRAPLVAIFEVAQRAIADGLPDGQAVGMNIGGTTRVRETTVHMTNAVHSSCFVGGGKVESGGNPAGFVIDSGTRVYHSGDTALFGDMAFIQEFLEPEVALLPIGDFYTMGPPSAARAVELLGVRDVIPMHYNTFPGIKQDPSAFRQRVEGKGKARVHILEPGREWG
jgi:L-ascorbate metabolism protein UlaG (beta-lactamase superfamily)